MNKLTSISINTVIFSLFGALVFFTPLIVVANTNELFEFPKMFFVYLVGAITIFGFLLNAIWRGKKVRLPNNLILAFVAANVISAVFSVELYTSFWGYYTRFTGGLISLFIYIGLYIVFSNVFDRPSFDRLLDFVLLAIVPISLYAILQHYGLLANAWKADATIRAFSTFGQPNWLAAYLAMLLPIVLVKTFKKQHLGALFLIGFAALWFTYSLSGLIGFIAGVTAALLLNKSEVKKEKKLVSVLFTLSLLIAVLNPGIFKEKAQDAFTDFKQVSIIKPVFAATYQISDSGNIRKGLWHGTLALISANPKNLILGTGPETFPYAFQPFRPEELNFTSEWDFVFNKPHNYYLELWANIGLIGLLPYLLIMSKVITAKDKLLTPSLIALFVTNIFGWPTVATSLLFWIFTAALSFDEI